MISRPITEDDLNAFIDARLDASRQAEVEAYLALHSEVNARVRAAISHREGLRALLVPIADEPIPARLNIHHLVEARAHRRRAQWPQALAASLALVVLGGAGGWTLRTWSLPPRYGVASLGQEAAESYVVYTPDRSHPVELRAVATPELVAWMSRRLGRRLEVPNLAASGYRFMGGRLVATPHGPAALFMYDNDRGARIVMLTRPMMAGKEAPMQSLNRAAVSGFSWAAGGMGYSLVGPSDRQNELHPIADDIRRQISHQI
jgi:anti-sigma factor RsiW